MKLRITTGKMKMTLIENLIQHKNVKIGHGTDWKRLICPEFKIRIRSEKRANQDLALARFTPLFRKLNVCGSLLDVELTNNTGATIHASVNIGSRYQHLHLTAHHKLVQVGPYQVLRSLQEDENLKDVYHYSIFVKGAGLVRFIENLPECGFNPPLTLSDLNMLILEDNRKKNSPEA